jgi:hypothetical protein
MDKQMLADHLALAERHVHNGMDRVLRQGDLIFKLERTGHDTRQAKALLVQFEDLLAIFIADRDRLRAELSEPAR